MADFHKQFVLHLSFIKHDLLRKIFQKRIALCFLHTCFLHIVLLLSEPHSFSGVLDLTEAISVSSEMTVRISFHFLPVLYSWLWRWKLSGRWKREKGRGFKCNAFFPGQSPDMFFLSHQLMIHWWFCSLFFFFFPQRESFSPYLCHYFHTFFFFFALTMSFFSRKTWRLLQSAMPIINNKKG